MDKSLGAIKSRLEKMARPMSVEILSAAAPLYEKYLLKRFTIDERPQTYDTILYTYVRTKAADEMASLI